MREVPSRYVCTDSVPGLTERWFTDERHDLFVWTDPDGEPARFQFCYGRGTGDEQMIEWRRDGGVRHRRVDDGERGGRSKESPLIITNGAWNLADVRNRLIVAARGIDPVIRSGILHALELADIRP
jgi:hypothetical protein